jgi:DNA primase
MSKTREHEQEQTMAQLSSTEEENARELLRDPMLLSRFLETIHALGCVGEEDNKILLLLAITSRILEKPVSVLVKGDSSAGKSYLVGKHKAVIMAERHGSEASDYSIRSLQSEGKLGYSKSIKKKDGNWETIDIEIEGPISFIETTTRSHIHPENETRCLAITVDTSIEQTQAIQRMLAQRYLGKKASGDAVNIWKNAQRLIRALPIIIPFAPDIKFPSQPVRARRAHQLFLSLIEASALLHQFQRERYNIRGITHIVADIPDYGIVYQLIQNTFSQTLQGPTKNAIELVDFVIGSGGEIASINDLAGKLRWDPKKVRKHIDEAVEFGYIEERESGQGRPTVIRHLKRFEGNEAGLYTPDELVCKLIPH